MPDQNTQADLLLSRSRIAALEDELAFVQGQLLKKMADDTRAIERTMDEAVRLSELQRIGLEKEIARLRDQLNEMAEERQRILGSLSWRVTSPMRRVYSRLARFRARFRARR